MSTLGKILAVITAGKGIQEGEVSGYFSKIEPDWGVIMMRARLVAILMLLRLMDTVISVHH